MIIERSYLILLRNFCLVIERDAVINDIKDIKKEK